MLQYDIETDNRTRTSRAAFPGHAISSFAAEHAPQNATGLPPHAGVTMCISSSTRPWSLRIIWPA